MKNSTAPRSSFLEVPALEVESFECISGLAKRVSGLHLDESKLNLVRARLSQRLRVLNLLRFEDYVEHLRTDASGEEIDILVDLLVTNKTQFFRQEEHFAYLKGHLLPLWTRQRSPIRLWSAGCSTGQEPYTLGMVLSQSLLDPMKHNVRILATDVSRPALRIASAGHYREEELEELPSENRCFFKRSGALPKDGFVVRSLIRNLVTFARLNLKNEWPMKGPFQAILCRNVMIYFDKPTRQSLVDRFFRLVKADGHLFLGEAESLNGLDTDFRYVRPGIYQKEEPSTGESQ